MRMIFKSLLPAVGLILCTSCANTNNKQEQARDEIRRAEKDFEKMAVEKGIAEAFSFFADTSAVIKRENDTLISGRDAIRNYYSADYFKSASVKWSPDFTDASEDGKWGYTYGKYIWQSKDSTGITHETTGVFHTVWKKQKDGTWKYTWD